MKNAFDRRHPRLRVTILFAATAVALAATPLPSQEAPVFIRQHDFLYLDATRVRALLEEMCQKAPEGTCDVRGVRGGQRSYVEVAATETMHEQIALALRAADAPPTPHRFQLVLLAADQSGAGLPQGLSPGVARALEDVGGFLPFTGYRLLDTGFVRATGQASLVLSGLEGRRYEAQIRFRSDATGEHLMIDRLTLFAPSHIQIGEPAPTGDAEGSASGTDPGGSTAARAPGVGLLGTSFPIARGETVVAGTSRLHGGEAAIVVLLTALP
jgi:hypothetical protein